MPSTFLLKGLQTIASIFMPSATPPMVAKALNGNHGPNGTPWTITIPTTAQPGDLALVVVGAINLNGAAHSTPAGWTRRHEASATAGFNNISALYTKVLTADDIGVSITFGSSGDKWNVGVRVYRDAAIDVSGFTAINSAGASIPQTSVAATRRGINVQLVTATGNQALNNWTRGAKASNFDFNLQFAAPAYAGQAHEETMVYGAGATTTAAGIGRGGSSTAAGVVNYNVVLYRTANLLTAVLDTFTRADTNVSNSSLAGLGTSSDAKVSYFEHALTAGGIFGINANQAYSQVSAGTSMVSVAELGTSRMTLGLKVPALPHASAKAGLAARYNLADHTGLAVTVELGGVLRVFNINTGAELTPGGLPTVAAGDTIGVECNGTTITIYKNSVAVGSLTSAINQTTGVFGGIYLQGATQAQNNFRADDLNITGYTPPTQGVYADNFNRPDAGSLGTSSDGSFTWTPRDGSLWAIVNNKATRTNPGNWSTRSAITCPGATAGSMSVTKAGGKIGLSFRHSTALTPSEANHNYIGVFSDDTGTTVTKYVEGAGTLLSSHPALPAGGRLRVDWDSTGYTVFINGAPESRVSNTDFATQTDVGLFTVENNTPLFEDFSLSLPA